MSEYNEITTNTNTRSGGGWVDDFAKIGNTLTGLAGAFTPYFVKNPTNEPAPPPPQEDPNWSGGGGAWNDDGPPPPPPPKLSTGKIILFSTLGLAVIGTVVYFIVKKKK